MLPEFPSLRRTLDSRIRFKIDSETMRKSYILSQVRGITQHEGQGHSFYQEGTGTVTQDYKEMRIPLTIPFADIPTLPGPKLDELIEKLATDKAQFYADEFYKTISAETAKVGNAFDAGGKPFTRELLLKMVERVEWTPDSVFVAHPSTVHLLASQWEEWKQDRPFMKIYNAVQERKKEEWRDRESNRKLVD